MKNSELNILQHINISGDASVVVVPHAAPGFLSHMREKLLAPRVAEAAVLPADALEHHATLAYSALRDSLQPPVGISEKQRKANIKAAKRQCIGVGFEAMRFFASHAWTGTHECPNFGAKIASAYCLIQVHNAAISPSGGSTNYKKREGQGSGGAVKRALGKGTGGVVVDKRRKASSDEDEEEEEEEEYGIQNRGDNGGDGGRGRRKCQKDSREKDDE